MDSQVAATFSLLRMHRLRSKLVDYVAYVIAKLSGVTVSLLAHEIRPGTVAILDATPLNKSDEISYADDKHEFRNGPFLCVQADSERSAWVNLTSQQDRRGLRLELKQEWRLDGSDIWRNKPQFIHDARKAFVGPNRVFVLAGEAELPHRPHKRPNLSVEGVTAVLAEMQKYGTKGL